MGSRRELISAFRRRVLPVKQDYEGSGVVILLQRQESARVEVPRVLDDVEALPAKQESDRGASELLPAKQGSGGQTSRHAPCLGLLQPGIALGPATRPRCP
jgi:hypothetical protein